MVSATSPRGRGLQVDLDLLRDHFTPWVSATSPRGRGLQALVGDYETSNLIWFQRHRPVAGDCKLTLNGAYANTCFSFSDIAPWQGTARIDVNDLQNEQGGVSATSPRGRGLQVLVQRQCALLKIQVSATSPRGRGLQVQGCASLREIGWRFSDIAPWQGTASALCRAGGYPNFGFSDIAPWQGTASCRGFWRAVSLQRVFQRHRPVAGDCKGGSLWKDFMPLLVSATSPRGRGLQAPTFLARCKMLKVSATSPRGRGLQESSGALSSHF